MREISVEELKSWKDSGREFQLIDVREPYEYEWNNINGINIPLAECIDRRSEINTEGDVVMHCNSGARAAAMIDVLETKYGFTNLINLEGGIQAWGEKIDSSKLPY